MLQDDNGQIPIWDRALKKVLLLDTNLKDPTFIKWSKQGPQLAIGTAKGNLLIYDKARKKKIPILGKHPRAITCGDWAAKGDNHLCLGSEDRTMTISNEGGDTIEQTELKFAAYDLQVRGNDGGQLSHACLAYYPCSPTPLPRDDMTYPFPPPPPLHPLCSSPPKRRASHPPAPSSSSPRTTPWCP